MVVSSFQELSEVVTVGYGLDSPGKASLSPGMIVKNLPLDPAGEGSLESAQAPRKLDQREVGVFGPRW